MNWLKAVVNEIIILCFLYIIYIVISNSAFKLEKEDKSDSWSKIDFIHLHLSQFTNIYFEIIFWNFQLDKISSEKSKKKIGYTPKSRILTWVQHSICTYFNRLFLNRDCDQFCFFI